MRSMMKLGTHGEFRVDLPTSDNNTASLNVTWDADGVSVKSIHCPDKMAIPVAAIVAKVLAGLCGAPPAITYSGELFSLPIVAGVDPAKPGAEQTVVQRFNTKMKLPGYGDCIPRSALSRVDDKALSKEDGDDSTCHVVSDDSAAGQTEGYARVIESERKPLVAEHVAGPGFNPQEVAKQLMPTAAPTIQQAVGDILGTIAGVPILASKDEPAKDAAPALVIQETKRGGPRGPRAKTRAIEIGEIRARCGDAPCEWEHLAGLIGVHTDDLRRVELLPAHNDAHAAWIAKHQPKVKPDIGSLTKCAVDLGVEHAADGKEAIGMTIFGELPAFSPLSYAQGKELHAAYCNAHQVRCNIDRAAALARIAEDEANEAPVNEVTGEPLYCERCGEKSESLLNGFCGICQPILPVALAARDPEDAPNDDLAAVIQLLSNPPMPADLSPLDRKRDSGDLQFADSAYMRIFFGLSLTTWYAEHPDHDPSPPARPMVTLTSDEGVEEFVDLLNRVDLQTDGSIPQISAFMSQGSVYEVKELAKAKIADRRRGK